MRNVDNDEHKINLKVTREHKKVATAFEECWQKMLFKDRKECINNIEGLDEHAINNHCEDLHRERNENFAPGSFEHCVFSGEVLLEKEYNCSTLEFPDVYNICNALVKLNITLCDNIEDINLRNVCISSLE